LRDLDSEDRQTARYRVLPLTNTAADRTGQSDVKSQKLFELISQLRRRLSSMDFSASAMVDLEPLSEPTPGESLQAMRQADLTSRAGSYIA
jgi:hypothetical protein